MKNERLINTGLLGSLRWWFEVLVRGLGGSACDPTATKCEGEEHCVVCELFGCTGWARKFRFEVLDGQGNIQTKQIKINQHNPEQPTFFYLRLTPLRPIQPEEWALLAATLRLIAGYGAIGGKTVLKPSDESGRAKMPQHEDYGLIELIRFEPPLDRSIERSFLEKYVSLNKWEKPSHEGFVWASLKNFWCVKERYLARHKNGDISSFNHVVGRPEPKRNSNEKDSWLAGRKPRITCTGEKREAESKKVFSFKSSARTFGFVENDKVRSENQRPRARAVRTFGFVNPPLINFGIMKQRLEKVWGKDGWCFLQGDEIIKQIFDGNEVRP